MDSSHVPNTNMPTLTKKGFLRKKQFLINRNFQFRIIWAAVLVGSISTILTSFLILYPLYEFQILRATRFLPPPIIIAMLCAGVLNIFVVGFMGVFFSHRIAGPMHSILRFLRRLSTARYGSRMKIRNGDELKLLVRQTNELAECLHKVTENDLKLVKLALMELEKNQNDTILSSINSLKAYSQQLELRLERDGIKKDPLTQV